MRKTVVMTTALLMAAAIIGCAGKPVTWRAAPAAVSARALDTDVEMEPLRQDNPFYTAFRLTLTNTGPSPVSVEWNSSGYLINDRPAGLLWFHGVTAEAIKEKSIPPDTVAPGERLSRVVAPLQLIAITPLKQSTRQDPPFSAGRLPSGKNSIRLTLIRNDTATPVTLSVAITAHESQ